MKGIMIDIYKNAWGSSSNDGISSHFDTAILLCPGGYLDPAEHDKPCVTIIRRPIGDYAIPCDPNGQGGYKSGQVGPMFGGTFIYSSDSRFREHCGSQPVALHDRWETYEQYERLSR